MHSNEQINETTTTSTTRLYSYLINVLMTIYFSKWITSLFQTNYLPSVWKCWQNLYKKYKEECYCNPKSCPYIDNLSYGNVQRYIFKMIDNKSHIGRYKHKDWPSFTNEITDENQFKTTHTNAIAPQYARGIITVEITCHNHCTATPGLCTCYNSFKAHIISTHHVDTSEPPKQSTSKPTSK